MNNKNVIFIYDEPKYFIPFLKDKGILAYPLFKELSLSLRIIRKLFFLFRLPKNTWYADWKYHLHSATTIIVFSTEYIEALSYIKAINPELRIIFWYWNPVFRSINPNQIPDDICEKWSFDKHDCDVFKMRHNTTFYLDNIKLPENRVIYDMVFVGLDKGRKAFISDFRDKATTQGLKPYLCIIDNAQKERVPYSDYLMLVSKADAIFDYIQEGQHGSTLRPMESIFLQKKLITNDTSIMLTDFYSPDNVFIIGINKMESLKHFLTIPYNPVSGEILKRYDVSSWVKRFMEHSD